MKNLLLGFILLFALSAYSQSTHTIDFEPLGVGADWDWSMQENGTNPPLEFIANPVSGGINTSSKVAKFTALQTGNPWALVFTDDDGQFTFDASNCIVKIMVYKEVLTNIGIKFEGFSTPVELQVANTLINQWEEVTFDFTGSIGNTYSRLVVIPDFAARTEDHIIYFDNIQLPDGVPVGPLPEPTTVPPTPPQAAENVLSIYSEAYTNLAGTNFNPNWGQATTVTVDYLAAGNKTIRYENLNYQGTEFPNQDVSGYEYIHIDFWTPNSTVLNFYLISPGNEIAYSLPITAETWVSVDIPLSSFVPPVNLADVFQFKVDGSGHVYFDNWYFWKSSIIPGTDATLSDLKVDGTTIAGFSPSIHNYNVELPLGTTIVPTLTATTNDPFASYEITNATSLPGTSEVEVTSMDGSTTLIYTVNFTLESPEPSTVPPVPTHPTGDVLSIYSDAYVNMDGVNFNPIWGQQTIVTLDYSVAGNNTLRYEDLDFQGTEFPTMDVTDYDYFHVDFWTSNATELAFFMISEGPLQKEYNFTIDPNNWVSVDIPLSHFDPPVNLNELFQFMVTGDGDVWFDNWYFWKNPINPESDASLSDLLVDGTTVDGFSSSTLNYTVELPFGTSNVPEVTAVTTVEDATFVINDAAALPGTTEVVVTSQDETNTMTYTIAFTVAPETPLSEYCETEVWHFNNPAEVPSAIYLTISNVNANSMIVEIESATDDPVDFLLVLGGSGAQISDQNTSVPGKISRTLTWAETPPADVLLNVLWSKLTFPGNWMLSQTDITVPFDAGCSGVAGYLTFDPQDGAVDVPVDIMPTLTFSVPVEMADGSEVTNADIPSLLVFNLDDANGNAVAYSGSINAAKTVISIVPDMDLELGQDYYVALNNQVLRYMEGELVSGQDATFSTPAAPKPYLAIDVQDNFESNGWATIDNWMFQDSPDLVDLTTTVDPVNPANHAADYTRTGAFLYTNAQCVLDHRMNLTERNIFKLKVYFPSSNDYTGDLAATAAIKLQNSLLGGLAYTTQTEVLQTITQFDQWVVLEFDFELASDSLNYDQVVVQLGGENHLVPAQFYFDNLELLKKGPQAGFSATPVNGFAPLTVQFTDESDFVALNWKWDFDNDGVIDATVKNPQYTYTTPGSYSVKLIASHPFIGSDEILKTDYITVMEPPMQHMVDLPAGWSGISSYVIPEDASIETIFGSIAGDVEIMLGDDGMYYPSQGVNTIVDWNSQSGYVVKMINNAQVTFAGAEATNGSLTLAAGWSVVPVLSACDVDVQDLFGGFDQLVAIKEVAGTGIYWPAKSINTLPTLIPGKAYYFLTDEELMFTYPSCTGDELIWSDEFDEGEVNTDN